MPDEFRFTAESPACSADASGIFERLEAILAELRAMRADANKPTAVHLSVDGIYTPTKRR